MIQIHESMQNNEIDLKYRIKNFILTTRVD